MKISAAVLTLLVIIASAVAASAADRPHTDYRTGYAPVGCGNNAPATTA